jgi:very-short-patch-repair endonuclease
MAQHDIVAALAGDSEAQAALREKGSASEIPTSDFVPPSDEFLVLDADASQNYAINAILAGKSLIIKGPPGTGKSQTISNLVSTLIARGKRVLFVAEKRAAIDAVLRRLEEVGLGDVVLDLHGGVSSKRKVAEDLSAALARNASLAKPKIEGLHRILVQRRTQLNEHAEALHAERAPWQVSYFEVQSRLLELPSAAVTDIRFRGPVLEGLGEAELAQSIEDLQAYVGGGGLQLRHSDSPWARATVVSVQEAQEIQVEVEALRRQVPEVLGNLSRAATEAGVCDAETLHGWAQRFDLWHRVRAVLETWRPSVFELQLEQVLKASAPLDESTMSRFSATLTSSDYRAARKHLRGALREGQRASPSELRQGAEKIRALELESEAVALAPGSAPTFPSEVDALQASYDEICARLEALDDRLDRGPFEGGVEDVLSRLDALLSDVATLAKLPELHRLRIDLEGAQLQELLAALEARPVSRGEVADVLRYAWLKSLAEHLQLSDRLLGAFDGEQHHQLVREFQQADREHIETTPQRVRRLCAEQAVAAQDAAPDDARLITAEAHKKRKHLATRQLFSAAPEVMMALKPCWAMSPLVVSQVLPADRPYFDVVVFDEASQVRPAEAMPAILRGKQLVVAGDERQLPPTSFFSGTNPDLEEDADAAPDLAVDASYESILEALAAFIDFRMLEWHYRSRDERLIAFSNVHLYDRGLTTFPGVVGPDCIRHVHVPFVPGELGSETSASDEVATVVGLILEHVEQRPDKSLGVIAMGMKHADRIDEALREALRDREEELAEFFDEARYEPFFIKNLERVQGDERDAIILSVGYGKNADGRLLYRFGPVNMEGGERRLNVAVTRAKERMTLVSAFTHHDMDPERSSARGVELLRAYLEYCASNGSQLSQAAASIPELNPFEVDVRDNLARAGIPLVPQYGCSGYRIDYAAKHPTQPGRMVLAIECDGASYHSSSSARDRDRLRQEHLERLGWTFHRIWSQDWFTNKVAEVENVKAAYELAVENANQADAADNNPEEGEMFDPPDARVGPPPGGSAAKQGSLLERGPCPIRVGRRSIDDYSTRELVRLIGWIESDTLLRTKAQVLEVVILELGFRRRGSKIVAAIERAIDASRRTG